MDLNAFRASRFPLAPAPRTIAVLRALQLGDLLCSVPALRALRAAFPAARISLIGLPWAREFARRFRRYVDEFIEFPGYPGLPERIPDLERIPGFIAEMQSRRFDALFQLQGSGRITNPIAALMKPHRLAGYYVPGQWCPNADTFLPFPQHEPEIRQPLRLLEFLGVPTRGDALEFPLEEADLRELEALEEFSQIGAEYVCVHAGSRMPSRRWLPERFAETADALAQDGFRIVLTGASREEIELADQVQKAMRFPSLNLAGKTTLGAAAALISRARLLVCNDTGVSHIAAGLRVPSVIIVTGSDPARWAPLDGSLHRPRFHPIECRPCAFFECPIGQPCARSVEVDEVIEEARRLLARRAPLPLS